MYDGFVTEALDVIRQERKLTRERLQESKRALMAEIRRIDGLLADLDNTERVRKSHDYAPVYGTLWALRKFVIQLRIGEEVTAGQATKWMLANGWRTTSKTPQATASSAMKHMADRGEAPGLEWAGTGKYRRI